MIRTGFKLFFIAVAVTLSVLLFYRPVFAQQSTTLSLSPVTFELSADPGQTITNQIKVTNLSNSDLQLETKIENISGTGDEGQVQLTEDDTKFSLTSWIKTTPDHFTLSGKEAKIINFTITVPAQTEPGGHYGTILIGTVASDTPGLTGASTVQRIGSLLLIKVSGQAEEQALVGSFTSKSFVGSWDEKSGSDGKTKFLFPKNEQSTLEKVQRYFNNGPIAFEAMVHNSGNIHVKPVGYVQIYNLFNQKIADLPISPLNVFPGNDRKLTIIWPSHTLWGIFYRAQLTALYGSTNQPLTAYVTFWAFPKIAAISIAILMLLVVLARKRLVRMFQVLIKGQ